MNNLVDVALVDRICEGLPPEAREAWVAMKVALLTYLDGVEYIMWVIGPCEYGCDRLDALIASEREWWVVT